jgi:hypothetical protein
MHICMNIKLIWIAIFIASVPQFQIPARNQQFSFNFSTKSTICLVTLLTTESSTYYYFGIQRLSRPQANSAFRRIYVNDIIWDRSSNLQFIINSTVKLQEGAAFLRGKSPIRAATNWRDKTITVKGLVGFPFSCGQCHSRTRQKLIKGQKNNTVIEKGRYVTLSHPGFYLVLEKHTTVYLIKIL